jgi:squalene-hopene/tetraprenyl-beta-curcumene cyclase
MKIRMEIRTGGVCLVLSVAAVGCFLARTATVHGAASGAGDTTSQTWNRHAAANFLDQRETWWQAWPRAQKDHGTLCISCHTVVPYAMVMPELRRDLGEAAMTPPEKIMLASVEKRVNGWAEMLPFYSDEKYGKGKAAESRATEAVLNAIILSSYDRAQGQLRPVTHKGFEELWALQESDGPLAGGWKWQDFHLGPWESTESGYQGAALLMVEAVNLPGGFAREPETREHLDRLRDYLRRYASQPLVNQLYVLWASAKEPKLLNRAERKVLLDSLRAQQQSDGGFRTASVDVRERVDHTAQSTSSDGYATGLAALALEAIATPYEDPMLRRSLDWLTQHQQSDGTWAAVSLNKQRDPASDPGLFMTDAATAYAALALEHRP